MRYRILTPSLRWLSVALALRVLALILANYPDYFPPNFDSLFLQGREATFAGVYRPAFYVPIVSGPVVLFTGMPRTYVLICSAVVLRLVSGAAGLAGVPSPEAAYIAAAWCSWLVPLAVLEFAERWLTQRPAKASESPRADCWWRRRSRVTDR